MEFFNTLFGKIISTFFGAMIPVLELRTAIPMGYNGGNGLELWLATIIAILGNMVPVPFIILFVRKIFEWIRNKSKKLDKLVVYFENKAEKHRGKVEKSKFWGLLILVAIPLPGTGAWTGALVAAMLEMRLKDSVPAIFLGVVAAGIIVALATAGVVTLVF